MSNTTYFKVHKKFSFLIHNTAWDEMKKAGEEERRLALEAGDIDENGTAMCTVVADGQWSKRSYKTKYDALSGVVRGQIKITVFFNKITLLFYN